MRSMQPRPVHVLELNNYLLHLQVHNTAIFLVLSSSLHETEKKKKQEKEVNQNG